MTNVVAGAINTVDRKIGEKVVNEAAQKQTPLDTALKWAPFALLIGYDALRVKARSSCRQHIAQMFVAQVLLNAAVRPVKKAINRTRPNGRGNSFPSAHTATAFVASEIIRRELRENSVALQYSGYALALPTAWLRLYRKKHWPSDVLAGALAGYFFGRLAGRRIGE